MFIYCTNHKKEITPESWSFYGVHLNKNPNDITLDLNISCVAFFLCFLTHTMNMGIFKRNKKEHQNLISYIYECLKDNLVFNGPKVGCEYQNSKQKLASIFCLYFLCEALVIAVIYILLIGLVAWLEYRIFPYKFLYYYVIHILISYCCNFILFFILCLIKININIFVLCLFLLIYNLSLTLSIDKCCEYFYLLIVVFLLIFACNIFLIIN